MKEFVLGSVLVACVSATPSRVIHVRSTVDAASLAAAADRELAASLELDYRRPFVAGSDRRAVVRRHYRDACMAGDHRSCWMVGALRDGDGRRDDSADRYVADNCRRGDLMSCRARVRSSDQQLDGFPGQYGRWQVCSQLDPECPIDEVRRECDAGFPASCDVVAKATDDDRAAGRRVELQQQGCAAGLVGECLSIYFDRDLGDIAPRQLCNLLLVKCEVAAARSSPVGGGYLELQCQQTGDRDGCASAVESYWRRSIVEPVPNRRQSLIEWFCRDPLKRTTDICREPR